MTEFLFTPLMSPNMNWTSVEESVMHPFVEPIFPVGQASALAGLSEKTVRNWIDREQIDLPDPAPGMVRRRLAMVDILKLALVGSVVKYGFEVADANSVVSAILRKLLPGMAKKFGDRTLNSFMGLYLVLTWDEDAERPYRLSSVQCLEKDTAGLDTFAVINLGSIISACGARFKEAVKSGWVVKAAVELAQEMV